MPRFRRHFVWLVAAVVFSMSSLALLAEAGVVARSAVGGVSIDVNGVVSHPTVDEFKSLQKLRQKIGEATPADLDQLSQLRFVSLKGLERQIDESNKRMLPLPESVRYLAGLQRIEYVLVDPQRNDIILAGPADGWKMDQLGNVVGKTSGRPVLLLDDLMVALRTRRTTAQGGIACSIDPTPEGVARLRELTRQLKSIGNPQQTMAQMENALGDQVVSVTGVERTSHFARVMVAADFRMKRLGMNLEPSPVKDMPSYLHLLSASSGIQTPRWWLAPSYEPLRRDADGLTWQIRGQGVKCMTEQDFFTDDGTRHHTGKTSKAAKKWADMFSAKFDELAAKDSAFGKLRNVMDLAVAAALIEKHHLFSKAQLELPHILENEILEKFNAPLTVPSRASFVKKGRRWLVSASGGVELYPWEIVAKSETMSPPQALAVKRPRADVWWWD